MSCRIDSEERASRTECDYEIVQSMRKRMCSGCPVRSRSLISPRTRYGNQKHTDQQVVGSMTSDRDAEASHKEHCCEEQFQPRIETKT